jgi:hypothetical protein
MRRFHNLLAKFKPVPASWFEGSKAKSVAHSQPTSPPMECRSYEELVDVWRDTRNEPEGKPGALYWTDTIDVTFSSMLSVIASTKLQGAQLFLRVLGPPGTVKTTLCEALSANKQYTFPMSQMTGFHSGQDGNELFQLIDGKTVIMNEGDMLLHAANRDQTLAQIRDMWSGKIRAHYRNGVSYALEGLRTTFIIAGTATLRKLNRSAAGDRFLDTVVYERANKGSADKQEMDLLNRVALMALTRCGAESDGTPESQDDPLKVRAVQKTAGFVSWLRETAPKQAGELIKEVTSNIKANRPPAWAISCIQLAQLVAYMRARPDDKSESDETEVELASRLTEQFIRLAVCQSIVLGRPVDDEVMRRVARVAKDTCWGRTFKIASTILEHGAMDLRGLEHRLGYKKDTVESCVTILKTIGCVRAEKQVAVSGAYGRQAHILKLAPQTSGLLTKLHDLIGKSPDA